MKLKQLLEQLNQLAKERPEALEMEISIETRKLRICLNINDVEVGHVISVTQGVIQKIIIKAE